jgi:uncharacterized membrane protein YdjX (TVP38/TMEM64 family)
MMHSPTFRAGLITIWVSSILAGIYFYATRADLLRDEMLVLSSTSTALASMLYLVVGCVRGFTLIPVTYLIPFGLLFLPSTLQFVLTMVGILVSSASIYYFSERLRLAEYFEAHHAHQANRIRRLLQKRELPIVVAWSVFPLVPTDVICYVCGSLRVDIRKLIAGVLIGEGLTCAIYIFLGRELVSFIL